MKKLFIGVLIVLTMSSVVIAENVFKSLKNSQSFGKSEQFFNRSLFQENSERGWILNGEGKKALKNLILQLPCGWPEYGIPPLAPYTKEELNVHFKQKLIETFSKLIHFKVNGLQHMLIEKLKISFAFVKKVKYRLLLSKIVITSDVVSDILLDLLEEYGISVRYDGEGSLEIILEDIVIDGSFKYKAPLMFGSVKIYDFLATISLGKVVSNIKFVDTLNKFNELLNSKIEDYLWRMVNYNKNRISVLIEESVVPLVNAKLKGHKIWYLIGLLADLNRTCYPPPIPWECE